MKEFIIVVIYSVVSMLLVNLVSEPLSELLLQIMAISAILMWQRESYKNNWYD